MLNLEDVSLFINVVELGSFTKASEYLGIPKSTISRRVRDLESLLSTRLIERTTRKISLTTAGEKFIVQAEQLIEQAEILENETLNEQKTTAGNVVVYAPVFVNELCADLIAAYCREHPGFRLELLSDSQGDQEILEKRFDVLVTYGEQEDSSLVSMNMATLNFDYYISPLFIERYGYPHSPQEIQHFNTVCHVSGANDHIEWQFGDMKIPIEPVVRVDSIYMLLSLACSGLGIVCLPKVLGVREVKRGTLIPLFDSAFEYPQTIYALYHSKRFLPHRIRNVLDYMESIIQDAIDKGEQGEY